MRLIIWQQQGILLKKTPLILGALSSETPMQFYKFKSSNSSYSYINSIILLEVWDSFIQELDINLWDIILSLF